MSKEMSVIVLGIVIVIIPQLGIPGSWRTVLLTLAGLCLIGLGLYLRSESLGRGDGASTRNRSNLFVQSQEPVSHDKEGITSLN